MSELREWIYSKKESSSKGGMEGEVITGRGLRRYEKELGIRSEELSMQRVLNFGAGNSHLGNELAKNGIPSMVVDVDLNLHPEQQASAMPAWISYLPLDISTSTLVPPLAELAPYIDVALPTATVDIPLIFSKKSPLPKWYAKAQHEKDRTFVQANGRNLPFPDAAFDTVLALWSTYQVPLEHKKSVFDNLLRVGNHIHIGPTYGVDLDAINAAVNEHGTHQVIYSGSPKKIPTTSGRIASETDYAELTRHPFITQPPKNDAIGTKFMGISAGRGAGNLTVVSRIS